MDPLQPMTKRSVGEQYDLVEEGQRNVQNSFLSRLSSIKRNDHSQEIINLTIALSGIAINCNGDFT